MKSASGDRQQQPNTGFLGIGLDSCVIPTRHAGVSLVQTTDFFYPSVDDPYMQGKIACANVLSDLYATGVTECDNMLMLLGISTDLSAVERDVVIPLLMKGFNDNARAGGTEVNGGQTVLNPWILCGGVASSVVSKEEVIMPDGAEVGDVIVLTKPLGTQIAVNANQWLEKPDRWSNISHVVTVETVERAYEMAMHSMARLNRNAALLMRKYGAHCATDVTGFGILGHARNLAESQRENVDLQIDTLPVIGGMVAVFNACGINFRLLEGFSAETSGGLLVCLPRVAALEFCQELEGLDGQPAWIIGDVVEGSRTAKITDLPTIIEC